jgi:ubiquinone/menaquinone biosynthesis C-methylase UbiE
MAAQWPEVELFGIDLSEAMIKEARNLAPDISFQTAPAESIPFRGNTMDIITSSLSFHHWQDQGKGLKEIKRVLKPNGLFCLSDHIMPGWMVKILHPGTKTQNKKGIIALLNKVNMSIIGQNRIYYLVLVTLSKKIT